MGFLYGNTNVNLPRTHFDIEFVYANRADMVYWVEEFEPDTAEEESMVVPMGTYLLVDYNFGDAGYVANANIDKTNYGNNNFDLTVWQVQKVADIKRAVAIARLHSVIPTFEVCGNYRFDVLEPMSDGDYFGKGKNIFELNATTNIPTGNVQN